MASIIRKEAGKLLKEYENIFTGKTSTAITTSNLNALWRLYIYRNRLISNKSKVSKDRREVDPAKLVPNTKAGEQVAQERRIKINPSLRPGPTVLGNAIDPALNGGLKQPRTVERNGNIIAIINPFEGEGGFNVIELQGLPSDINIDISSNWAVIKSYGRNNPIYFYTGSEDTVSFDITWYANDEDRKDVLQKCRILESWSKADGVESSPPELIICWGNSEIFRDDSFILTNASYSLSNFQASYRDQETKEIVDLGMVPTVATQTLEFKRVTPDNRTYEEIQEV